MIKNGYAQLNGGKKLTLRTSTVTGIALLVEGHCQTDALTAWEDSCSTLITTFRERGIPRDVSILQILEQCVRTTIEVKEAEALQSIERQIRESVAAGR